LASLSTVRTRFGGWLSALEVVGLSRSSRRGPGPRWDAAACWQALLSINDQLSDPCWYRRYLERARERKDLPSGSISTRRPGLWPQIVAELSVTDAPTLALL